MPRMLPRTDRSGGIRRVIAEAIATRPRPCTRNHTRASQAHFGLASALANEPCLFSPGPAPDVFQVTKLFMCSFLTQPVRHHSQKHLHIDACLYLGLVRLCWSPFCHCLCYLKYSTTSQHHFFSPCFFTQPFALCKYMSYRLM